MATVCNNQDSFNTAFYKALKYSNKKETKKLGTVLIIYVIIHMIFVVWGVLLAFKSQPPENRVVHITLALVFAPAYVLSYYINEY